MFLLVVAAAELVQCTKSWFSACKPHIVRSLSRMPRDGARSFVFFDFPFFDAESQRLLAGTPPAQVLSWDHKRQLIMMIVFCVSFLLFQYVDNKAALRTACSLRMS